MIAIVDYGMGNLRSVEKALEKLGHAACITSDPGEIAAAERMILPGVGAFGAAMEHLRSSTNSQIALEPAVREFIASGRPVLGICLGMQLLLDESDELGRHAGLGVIPGKVRRFELEDRTDLKIPHMGWNRLDVRQDHPLLAGLGEGSFVYFVHSYICIPDDPAAALATADHGGPFCAALCAGNVVATQFHPEKSGEPGLRILDNFARLEAT